MTRKGTEAPIIQYWHSEEIPRLIATMQATFRERNPNMPHLVFNERTAAEFIEERYGHRHADAFVSCAVPAMQSDYIRFCAVHSLGGVYADANFACSRDLAPLLESEGQLFEQPPLGPVISGLFAFRSPGHPLLAMSIEAATRNIEIRLSDVSGLMGGPAILTGLTQLYRGGPLEELRRVTRPSWRAEVDACLEEMSKSLHMAIEQHGPLARAFQGVRFSSHAEMQRWVEKPPLKSTNPDGHWAHWKGSAFRTTANRRAG